eukprot:TRINITY_DN111219_c0_g1_i1.p1 TRINITY_DN111219_c0_g1~~TRINITY_DN111219_c0_g1_i1.p1  ORF type:complete len:400 (+),score=32.84 TRINITY_DN111219_c0_g1_i1:83-1282(+)
MLELLGTFRMDAVVPNAAEMALCQKVWQFEHVGVIASTGDFSCHANFGHLLYNYALPMFVHIASCPERSSREERSKNTSFYVRDVGFASRALTSLLPQLHIEYAAWVPTPDSCARVVGYQSDLAADKISLPPMGAKLIEFYTDSAQYAISRSLDGVFVRPFVGVVQRFVEPIIHAATDGVLPGLVRSLTLVYRSKVTMPQNQKSVAREAKEQTGMALRGAERRSISNFDELSLMMRRFAMRYGLAFELADFQPASFAEDMKMLRRTQLLVGQHGAGLHNCLFLEAGSFVVELSRAWRLGFRTLFWPATVCSLFRNIHYFAFEEDTWAHNMTGQLPVDLAGLERFLTRQVVEIEKRWWCFPPASSLTHDLCCSRLHGEGGNPRCFDTETDASGATYDFCC